MNAEKISPDVQKLSGCSRAIAGTCKHQSIHASGHPAISVCTWGFNVWDYQNL